MKAILYKYSDNDKAMEYTIGKIINRNTSQNDILFDAYFDTVQSEFKEKDPKKAAKLTRMIFNTTDKSGNTFLDYKLKNCKQASSGKAFLANMLNKTKDYPEIQYEILMTKDKNGNNFLNPPEDSAISSIPTYTRSSIFEEDNEKTINDHIYKLTAETEEITVEDSIALLQEYGSILNGYNKENLDILTSESDDYTIFDRPENIDDIIPKRQSAEYGELPGTNSGEIEYSGNCNPPESLPGGFDELAGE